MKRLYWYIIIGALALALIIWFILYRPKNKEIIPPERALLLKERAEHTRELEIRDSVQHAREDSIIMELLGIKRQLVIKSKERERFTKIFIDTASIATKHRYLDSLFGPE